MDKQTNQSLTLDTKHALGYRKPSFVMYQSLRPMEFERTYVIRKFMLLPPIYPLDLHTYVNYQMGPSSDSFKL